MSFILSRYLCRQNRGAVTLGKGVLISATCIDDEKPFDVLITSSKRLARGSTADIYEGPASKLGCVALKVFAYSTGEDRVREQLVRRELRAAHRVRHSYILPLNGMAITASHIIIISPLMKNGNLLHHLQQHPTANRNSLVLQVAEALNYLHTIHGLVHGDIKCENVLISDAGDAVLADFGLSTFVDKHKPLPGNSITTTASPNIHIKEILSVTLPEVPVLYTTEFAGPELLFTSDLQGDQLPSKTTQLDVYAFGMLIIETFTGKRPWSGCTASAIVLKLHARAVHPHPGPSTLSRGLIDAWWRLCLACLDYDPVLRPSMGHVLDNLSASHIAYNIVQSFIKYSTLTAMRGELGNSCRMLEALGVFEQQWIANNQASVLNEIEIQSARQARNQVELRVLADLRSLEIHLKRTQRNKHEQVLESINYELLPPEQQAVVDAAFSLEFLSPDLVISGSWNGVLRVWNINTGETLDETRMAQTEGIFSLAVSPGGTLVAAASGARRICLWRFDGITLRNAGPALRVDNIQTLAFSPDGSHLISISYDGAVRVWGTRVEDLGQLVLHSPASQTRPSGQLDNQTIFVSSEAAPQASEIMSFAFSPTVSYVLCGTSCGSLCVWDLATGRQLGEPTRGHSGAVCSVVFMLDERRVISGSHDSTIRIWDWDDNLATAEPAGDPLSAHMGAVNCVASSSNGTCFASGSRDSTVRIWDAGAGQLEFTLIGHTGSVDSVAFSPTGRQIASASADLTIRLWDYDTGEAVAVLSGYTEPLHRVVFSPDGKRIISRSADSALKIWNRVDT